MLIFRANEQSFDSRFLYYVLKSPLFERQIRKAQSGTAQPQLPVRTINNFKIPVLELSEQKQLGVQLASIENQRKNYLDNLYVCDNLFNSLLQRAFRGEL